MKKKEHTSNIQKQEPNRRPILKRKRSVSQPNQGFVRVPKLKVPLPMGEKRMLLATEFFKQTPLFMQQLPAVPAAQVPTATEPPVVTSAQLQQTPASTNNEGGGKGKGRPKKGLSASTIANIAASVDEEMENLFANVGTSNTTAEKTK